MSLSGLLARKGRRCAPGLLAIAAGAMLLSPAAASAAGPLEDRDARSGRATPTAQQERLAQSRATSVRWNRFGIPQSMIRHGGFLDTGIRGGGPRQAAQNWLSETARSSGSARGRARRPADAFRASTRGRWRRR